MIFLEIIKFGGSSLQTLSLLDNAISIITSYRKPLIVVASAIGRRGFPFATDTLIESIKDNHLSSKEFDRLLGMGEIYSSILLSNMCQKNKIRAYALSYQEIGIVCDNNYGEGNIEIIDGYKINELLKEFDVLIVPGFIGNSKENELITLGRNTSDLSAILCAKMTKTDKVIFYKDVNGIYPTTISLINNKINYFKNLSYDEMLSLNSIGFNVVSFKACEEAKKYKISISIHNFTTKKEGTIISSIGSEYKILGFNLFFDEVKIATLYPDEIKNEIDILLRSHHIYKKDSQINKMNISFKISPNQMVIIKQLLINNYFKNLMK